MLSRALSLATVMLLIVFAAVPVQAQNLEAGKTPSQIFSSTCTVCHKGARGLLKTVAPGSLPGFLRQHYTTSSDMASLLSAYIISNGATDTRYGGGLTKQGQESRTAPKPGPEQAETPPPGRKPRSGAQEAIKPEPDGLQAEPGTRPVRNVKRQPRQENPDGAKPTAEGEQPAAATPPPSRQKLGRKRKPGRDEQPKPDAGDEPKGEAAKIEPKSEPARPEPPKQDVTKPVEEAKPESAKSDVPAMRADPVPAVTPAPKASDNEPRPAPSPAPSAPAPAAETPPPPPPLVESRPPPPPVAPAAPAGPPAPPISQ